ncbi:hypothetical protein [Halosimplex halophilum]|uniref:hypothetical protein n=1 Tax=Halosimplex halophilum TaxID=2559572 RepID=UPI0014354BA8|nr:hypothetical protein [Halosimplex halophilum]
MATTLPDSFAELARPELDGHTAKRWDQRMPAAAVAPETALADAVPVHPEARALFRTGHHPTPDDVLLYRGEADGEVYGAVFLVYDYDDGPEAVTVYRIRSRHDASLRAYCWARLAEYSADDQPDRRSA